MADREIGAQTASCPTCGSQLKAVDQPDGGVAYETCQTCYGPSEQQPAPQRASEATVAREHGTDVDDMEE